MGKYDNVTMKEYMKKKKEMLDDLGRKSGLCNGVKCENCPLFNTEMTSCHSFEMLNPDKALEIVMEYEPKVDWRKVEVDTKILVRDSKEANWKHRYFSKYEDEIIYAWNDGRTSFTSDYSEMTEWEYAKLYKGDK